MINIIKGNIFDSEVDVYVNPINCVSVMGAGLALQFKQKYPKMFKAYKEDCYLRKINIGKMWVWIDDKYIVNFPTKIHWKNPSKYEYITSGLIDLRRCIRDYGFENISIPALGCNNGGLKWEVVKELMIDALKDISNIEINIYEPLNDNI